MKYEQNQPVYAFAANTGSAVPIPPINAQPGASTVVTYPEPVIFYFKDTDTPVISNFDTLYVPIYGRHPRFTLIVYEDSLESDDSENEIVKYIEPKLTVVDDVITTVTYYLGGLGIVSGYIVINK